MLIGLIGYRGSGKSTVGAILSRRLNLPWIDTDQRIVSLAGKSIKDIFAQDGEPAFRDLETTVVREAVGQPDAIISFGGGALDRPDNRDALIAAPHRLIYLRCEIPELLRRIQSDPQTAQSRPNLTSLTGGEEEIAAVLARREPIWQQIATAQIDVTGLTPEQVADRIETIISPN